MSPARISAAGRPVATCDVCGAHAMFGFTAAAPSHDLISGRWYCHAHWRERVARERAAETAASPAQTLRPRRKPDLFGGT